MTDFTTETIRRPTQEAESLSLGILMTVRGKQPRMKNEDVHDALLLGIAGYIGVASMVAMGETAEARRERMIKRMDELTQYSLGQAEQDPTVNALAQVASLLQGKRP